MEVVIEGNFEKTIVLEANYSPVQSVNGQIGFVSITASGIGLGNVDNTADLDKPISLAAQTKISELEASLNQVYGLVDNVSSAQSASFESQDLKIRTPLESGIETKYILYPELLFERPRTVNCQIENDVDDIIYMHKVSNISNSGFLISFSDKLSNTGYFLNTQVGK